MILSLSIYLYIYVYIYHITAKNLPPQPYLVRADFWLPGSLGIFKARLGPKGGHCQETKRWKASGHAEENTKTWRIPSELRQKRQKKALQKVVFVSDGN
jgi:hypothetical protein